MSTGLRPRLTGKLTALFYIVPLSGFLGLYVTKRKAKGQGKKSTHHPQTRPRQGLGRGVSPQMSNYPTPLLP